MKFFELEPYKATCIVEQKDLDAYGITADDIFERTSSGYAFIHEVKKLTVKSTKREWPGCAFSMQISAYQNGDIALTFSETVEDFIHNLKQSRSLAGGEQNMLDKLIQELEARDEEGARTLIREFEKNVSDAGKGVS